MTRRMNRSLLVGAFVAVFAVPTIALSKAPGDQKFLPVLVLSTEGASGANEAVNGQIIETISDSLRKAVMSVYAEEIYGSGAAFKPKKFQSGPLGIVGRTFLRFDQSVQGQMSQGKLGKLLSEVTGPRTEYSMDVFWVKAPHSFPTMKESVWGAPSIAMLWNLAQSTMLPPGADRIGEVVSGLSSIAVVDAKDVPGGLPELINQRPAVYAWLAESNQQAILPLFVGLKLTVAPGQFSVDFRSVVKPGILSLKLDPPEPEDFIKSGELTYQPPFYSDHPGVARFKFSREYGRQPTRPSLTLSFGRGGGSDIRTLTMCSQQCAELDASGGAAHPIRSAPTVPGKLRVPDSLSKGAGATISKLAKKSVDVVNGGLDIFVMAQELYFDLGDPKGPRLVPEKSRVPLIIRTTDSLGNQTYVDVTQNRFGIEFFKNLVAEQTSKEVNETISKDVASADANGKKLFGEMTEGLKALFR